MLLSKTPQTLLGTPEGEVTTEKPAATVGWRVKIYLMAGRFISMTEGEAEKLRNKLTSALWNCRAGKDKATEDERTT